LYADSRPDGISKGTHINQPYNVQFYPQLRTKPFQEYRGSEQRPCVANDQVEIKSELVGLSFRWRVFQVATDE
jgi:hypothetical protein